MLFMRSLGSRAAPIVVCYRHGESGFLFVKDLVKGPMRGIATDSRLLPIIATLWPIFTRMSAVPPGD